MKVTKMRFIKKEESIILFDMQEDIISNNILGEVEKKCKLAILNTLEPLYDYYMAYDILDEQKYEMNYNSNLIGAYLGAVWIFDKTNEMLELLCKNINQYDEKKQAEIKYIEALHKFYRGINYINDIKKSFELFDRISAPYLFLLEKGNYSLMEKDKIISRIRSISLIKDVSKTELIDIDVFIDYFIRRNILSNIEFDGYLNTDNIKPKLDLTKDY